MLRFPRLHIAESTVNRIMNAKRGIDARSVSQQMIGIAANASQQGAALDNAIQSGPEPTDIPAGANVDILV